MDAVGKYQVMPEMSAALEPLTDGQIEGIRIEARWAKYQVLRSLTAEELRGLDADLCEAGGAREPVWLDQNGDVIDGIHRMLLCEKRGLPYPVNRVTVGSAAEARTMARRLNLGAKGRGATLEDRLKALEGQLEDTPEMSDHAIAALIGCGRETVRRRRKALEATGSLMPVEKRRGKDGKARRMPGKRAASPRPPAAAPPLQEPALSEAKGERGTNAVDRIEGEIVWWKAIGRELPARGGTLHAFTDRAAQSLCGDTANLGLERAQAWSDTALARARLDTPLPTVCARCAKCARNATSAADAATPLREAREAGTASGEYDLPDYSLAPEAGGKVLPSQRAPKLRRAPRSPGWPYEVSVPLNDEALSNALVDLAAERQETVEDAARRALRAGLDALRKGYVLPESIAESAEGG